MAITHKELVDMISMSRLIMSDEFALRTLEIFPQWNSMLSKQITQDMIDKGFDRYQYNGQLYKCVQPHTPQSDWTPDITPSLWVVIDVEHAGTLEDPIPAVASMEYVKGKYYIEDNVIYLMNREGMAEGESIVLHFTPSQLVGQYFEVVQ